MQKITLFEIGTCLEERLARGDQGINPLDCACKEHDIAYQSTEAEDRYLADKKLEKLAMKRITAKSASVGERVTAVGVTLAMKAKRALARSKRASTMNKPGVKRTKIIRRKVSGSKKKHTNTTSKTVKRAIRSVKKLKCCQNAKKKKRIIETPASFPISTSSSSSSSS